MVLNELSIDWFGVCVCQTWASPPTARTTTAPTCLTGRRGTPVPSSSPPASVAWTRGTRDLICRLSFVTRVRSPRTTIICIDLYYMDCKLSLRAARTGTAGRMWPAGRGLAGPALNHRPLLHGLLSPRTATLELTAYTFFYCLHSPLPFPLCN